MVPVLVRPRPHTIRSSSRVPREPRRRSHKVWLQLEEKRIPYKIFKVNMRCYGDKPRAFTDKARAPFASVPAAPASRSQTAHWAQRLADWAQNRAERAAQVPSGMLPAMEIDGQLLTDSARIQSALEQARESEDTHNTLSHRT